MRTRDIALDSQAMLQCGTVSMNQKYTSAAEMLRMRDVRKRYPAGLAADDINLAIARGELCALVGPNGAGKTTTLRLAAGLVEPDAGDIIVDGAAMRDDPDAARRKTAFVPAEPLLYSRLRPMEHIEFAASLWNIDARLAFRRGEELMKVFGLWRYRAEYNETLSRGARQKLALISAFVHEPELLIMDEPLNTLDQEAVVTFERLLSEHLQSGGAALLATHDFRYPEAFSAKIVVLNEGRVIADGTPEELKVRFNAATVSEIMIRASGSSN